MDILWDHHFSHKLSRIGRAMDAKDRIVALATILSWHEVFDLINRSARGIIKAIGVLMCMALLGFYFSEPVSSIRRLPEDVHILVGEQYELPIDLPAVFQVDSAQELLEASHQRAETLQEATGQEPEQTDAVVCVRLFGIAIKQVDVHVRESVTLIPGGSSIGVTLHTKGALVVGIGAVETDEGEISPAASAGVQAGDVIERINGIEIKSSSHLAQICNDSEGQVQLTISRNGERIEAKLHPVQDPTDKAYRMGMWVRDSTAGVGTLSFFDPNSNWYAALGHAVMDVDTRSNLTVREGEIVQSTIVDIVQGAQGEPGELRGTFGASSLPLGTIEANGDYGIYGQMYQGYRNALFPDGLSMGYPEEAKLGPAQILTMLDDEGVKAYDCEIVKVNQQGQPSPKGMVVEITDETLLKKTGGIVQGMSGSPLIQEGKLVGVVTHVFINDPTKGYCMYAQWMQRQISDLAG